jgi:hypothetical protein
MASLPTSSGPVNDRTFARCRDRGTRRSIPGMDGLTMVILAISALALLQIAAVNLRGEERRSRPRRQIRAIR